MKINEISEVVADFLYNKTKTNGTIKFYEAVYDDEEDRLTFPTKNDDEVVLVATLTKDGKELCLTFENDVLTFDLTDEAYDTNSDLYGILATMYYETEESWDVGDFELDLLGDR